MEYYLINVPGNYGYSFVVCGEFKDEHDAIDQSRDNDLFDDGLDSAYANAEIADDDTIDHFKQINCITYL